MRGRQSKAGVAESGAHAIAALAYSSIRQYNGREAILRHLNAGEIHLNVDDVRVDAVHRSTQRLEMHPWARLLFPGKTQNNERISKKAGHKGCRATGKSPSLLP